jgi:hypothetical protein
LIQQQHVEITLYLLAIVLATYGLWERFPKAHPGQQLALAAALLTLFLTFFLTSIRIDQTKEEIISLRQDINATMLDERLRALKNAKDPVDNVLYDLLDRSSAALMAIHSGEGNLYEDEGIQFIAKAIEAELDQDPTSLQILAISVDSGEFDRSAVFSGYEDALTAAVEKKATVKRAYVLPNETWSKAMRDRAWLSSEPWLIAEKLSELKLDAVRRHYTNGIQCILVPQSILAKANSRDYDLILVSRASAVIFAANRVGENELHVVRLRPEITKNWLSRVKDLLDNGSAVRLRSYRPQPKRPVDDR